MSYFHFQSDDTDFNDKLESIQCEAVKSNGQQCKNKTVIGHVYCHVHRRKILKLQIKKSNIVNGGKGLFAVGDGIVFKPGQRICMYDGELIDVDELVRRYSNNTGPYAIELHDKDGEAVYEDAAIERGLGSLCNHSQNKSKINAKLSISKKNRAQILAIKNIRAGQEILVDYGDDYQFDEVGVCSSTNTSKYTC
jgi:SET domain-containing protein